MSDRIAVIGAGQMGNGIAHVFAQSGFPVTIIDVSAAALEKGVATIAKNLDRQVKKGTIDAAVQAETLARIGTATELDAAATSTVIIEAATENVALKFDIFAKLDAIAPAGAILASNTSSISITQIAARTKRPAAGDRHALHESGAGDAARGGHPRHRHQRRHRSAHRRAGEGGRQDPVGGERLSRLHRQPHPDADDQRGLLLPDGGRRQCASRSTR
ncbi:MAG: 3-hydroxyacyl-CoA dehydrogenase NAD-binding domain-containing protein [Gemmatimonadaceae bacterium]|nr:3-hydroxyacyl-CoA dehydrogenase NAD-binding domain-containing protein [Gemmatimonadaceae bacterium]